MTFICCVPVSCLLHTMGLVHRVTNASQQWTSHAELLSPKAHSEEDPDGEQRELSPSCYTFLFRGWSEPSASLRDPPVAVKASWVLCILEMATATWLQLLQCSNSHHGTGSSLNFPFPLFHGRGAGQERDQGKYLTQLGKKSKLSHLLTQQPE